MFRPRNDRGGGSVGLLRFFIALLFLVQVVVGDGEPATTATTTEPTTTIPTTTEDPFLPCKTTDNGTEFKFIFVKCTESDIIAGSGIFDVSKESDDSQINAFFGKFNGNISIEFRLENNPNVTSINFGNNKPVFERSVSIVNNEALVEIKGEPVFPQGDLVVRGNRNLTKESIEKLKTFGGNIQEVGECTQSPNCTANFGKCEYVYGDLDLTDFHQEQAPEFYPKNVSGCLRLYRDSGEDLNVTDFLREFLKVEEQTRECRQISVIEGYCVRNTEQEEIKKWVHNGNIEFINRKGCEYNCTEKDFNASQTGCTTERRTVKLPTLMEHGESSSKLAAQGKKKGSQKPVHCTTPHQNCDIFSGTLQINRLSNVTNLDVSTIHTIFGKILIFGSHKPSIHFPNLKKIIGRAPLIQIYKNKHIADLSFPVLEELQAHTDSAQTVVSIADNVRMSVNLTLKLEGLAQGRITIDGMPLPQYIIEKNRKINDPHNTEAYWFILIVGFVFVFALATFELLKLWFLYLCEQLKTESIVRHTLMQEFSIKEKLKGHSRRQHYFGKKSGVRWGGILEWDYIDHRYKQDPMPTPCYAEKMLANTMPATWRLLSHYFSRNYKDIEITLRHQSKVDKAYARKVLQKDQSVYGALAGLGFGFEHNYIKQRMKMRKQIREREMAMQEADPDEAEKVQRHERKYIKEEGLTETLNTEEHKALRHGRKPDKTQESMGKGPKSKKKPAVGNMGFNKK